MIKLHCNSCDGVYLTSLDVRFTKQCDNNCAFCIEKNGIKAQIQDVDKMIENTIKEKERTTVLILGGEPFINPEKLLKYVKGIRPYKKEIYITTSLPKSFLDFENNEIKEILDLIDGLNVSLNHYKSELNNEIFKASDKHNRIKVLYELNKKYADKIRVSINLVKGLIDTNQKLLNAIFCLESIGTKHVKINELQHTPELYVSFEDITCIKMKSPLSHGCQFEINNNLFYTDMKITLKRACFLVEPSRKASFSDLIKIIIKKFTKKITTCKVLYENGEISQGWKTRRN